jgi:1-pyrroline-5-carboxylate dehydrogenase
MGTFKNLEFFNINDATVLKAQQAAIEDIKNRLGQTYALPSALNSKKKVVSTNPFRPEEVVARFSALGTSDVETQVKKGTLAFQDWKRTTPEKRQELMETLANIIERRRYEFNALMMIETGKTWIEADADTCEAIDFVRYYAQSLNNWKQNEDLVRIPGQKNQLNYIPLGLGVVIAPWNFPLAILCGMTTASLVTGNTVIMKPSSDSAWIAYEFHKAVMEAGFPDSVCQLAIGGGADMGPPLINSASTRFICFTGSREVGIDIFQKGSAVHPRQIWLKRMILEMGGKDGILADETSDVDQVAQGAVAAAFGFSGQKCSACSRLVLVKEIAKDVTDRVVALTEKLKLGNPTEPTTQMGPVINKASFDKVGKYIEIGLSEGKLISGGKPCADMGNTWQPTVFSGIEQNDKLFQDEIFGPVLAITETPNFETGLNLMNATDYGLTGSVYTQDEKRKEQARSDFHVGNLYINRKCTGAMVGQHPFGGFNMSGTDSKAGGPDYLGQFLQPKSIAEKIS